ncbi:PucR family transcriptional regulator [Cohnella endophytica]|uniref:PucR family transcriptional regulator n=1 Tax=Cohnella endophytica TaxID=2419778 RepID=A0A494Y951_9BACL|nr:PucR family transcriptional regulator [Cohnella endophytica]RKP57203.1 PucR family transcriptional regulator [Cohnella endophytica]
MAMMPRKEKLPAIRSDKVQFTVKDLLHIPFLKDARIVTGDTGIHRAITRVNVLEATNSLSWIRPGEFLMTTGYPFRDEPEKLLQFVPELAKQGVAALGIRTKSYFEELAPEVVAEAEKHGLPLLELPGDCVLSDLVRIVMERVLALESSQLADLQNRIQSMTGLLLEGRGIYAFLDALEDLLGNPVSIVRENDKPWLSAQLRSPESSDDWPLLQSLTFRQVGRGVSSGFMLLQNAYRTYVSPVLAQKSKQACLVLIERNREIQPIDAISVDRLASLAGLELANVEAVREVEGKYLDQFIQDWLSGKIVTETDWKLRAEVCGCAIPDKTPMCALLVGWRKPESAEKLKEMARRLRSERLRLADGLLAAHVGNELAIILPITGESAAGSASSLIAKLLEELRLLFGDRELKLYAGRIVDRAEDLQGSWAQARRARQVTEVCGLPGEIISYDSLGVYSLLFLIPSGEEREQFLNRYAFPLQQADRKGGGRLVETLEMFFQCNGNIKLTSEKLFAHYNTIVYRLDKVKSILGVSLDDPEERLQLHLALKLAQINPAPY